MPWKLVFYLIVLAIILAFVGLNLGNTADISFGFVEFEDVPVFMGLFLSFFLGVVVAIPIAMNSSSRKTKARSEKRLERQKKREEKKQQKKKKTESSGEPPRIAATSEKPSTPKR